MWLSSIREPDTRAADTRAGDARAIEARAGDGKGVDTMAAESNPICSVQYSIQTHVMGAGHLGGMH